MPKAKILIVDDDSDFVFATRTVLEQNGYAVTSAGNGNQGKAVLSREKPDLVIVDVIMSSVLDGLNLCAFMKDDTECKDIPVIMVTSIANTDYTNLFPSDENIEIDAFLTKPIKASDLTGKIEEILSRKGVRT
jgi:response regulator RpfG family c-di-GMP phosphodiesterase